MVRGNVKHTSIKNGVKLRSCAVPTDLRTRAPAPSACSMASKTFAILLGAGFWAFSDGSLGGMTGRPLKPAEGIGVDIELPSLVCVVKNGLVSCVARVIIFESG